MLVRRFLASVGAAIDTFWPRIEHDWDLPDLGAERLASLEEETEVLEPRYSVEEVFKLREEQWANAPDPMELLGFCGNGCKRFQCTCTVPAFPGCSSPVTGSAGESRVDASEAASPDTPAAESPHSAAGALLADLAAELRDAVGDSYDPQRRLNEYVQLNLPLWHDEFVYKAFDFKEVASTLLMYFDITRK